MPKLIELHEATVVLEFTLTESRRIFDNAKAQAVKTGDWSLVNLMSDLDSFIKKNK